VGVEMGQSFHRPHGGVVKLGEDALAGMLRFAQLSEAATEAGGVLIGRHIADSKDVVIDRVTVPMAGDRRTRTRFDRAHRRHQKALDEAWERSSGTSVYLGEWHTHPEPLPTPSNIDLNDWRKRLVNDRVEADFLLFLIVGQREIRMWEGSRVVLGVTRLRERKELQRA